MTYVDEKKYSSETIARAFEYFSILRTLYPRLRTDYQLQSINLPKNLTSKINTTSDDEFLKAYFFQKCPQQQRNILLIIDEIYVKPQLTYRGGNVFGKAINSPDQYTTKILAFIFCSFSISIYLFTWIRTELISQIPNKKSYTKMEMYNHLYLYV